jgi:uncharacterized membrane protein YuzA (DUF378 family)
VIYVADATQVVFLLIGIAALAAVVKVFFFTKPGGKPGR